jgi:transketolase
VSAGVVVVISFSWAAIVTDVPETDRLYADAEASFPDWEVVKDVVDEFIDLALNYRQSGHPGGSRSKVHLLLSTMLSGAMRWDIRQPWLPFGDRFVLSAGHTVPVVYAALAALNETLRIRSTRDSNPAFAFPDAGRWALTYEHLLGLRHRGGLPGHPEMAGRSLFLKFNTGPSGHGMPPAAGEALALKLAGASGVRVFVVEGEGGLTAGASHETRNAAWGMGLSNLVFLVDWNDFGIDDFAASSVVPGTPETWFGAYGWRVSGTTDGSEWAPVTRAVLDASCGDNPEGVPSVAWFRTRKGRGYLKYDNKSHGSPHAMNSAPFWELRNAFMAKYGISYVGVNEPAPSDPAALHQQAAENLRRAANVLADHPAVVDAISDRLLALAGQVPEHIDGLRVAGHGADVFTDPRLTDYRSYPDDLYRKPGEKQPNRAAFGAWASWVNATARRDYGRPLFIAASADLADSTALAGFGKDFGDMPGYGWYQRTTNIDGALLPTEITEFTNAGMIVGLATVNLSSDPFSSFNGFWGACSTYGSFSYLKYGEMRLFSQLAQDCELKVGKVLWVAGHSGPETAEDSRTHFGIYEPGVTQLFPEGKVIDLHPWEFNEVPVVLAAALATDVPIVALHLTRPAIELPDREALGMPSHFEAARGAYVLRQFRSDLPAMGTVFVQGTTSTANLVKALPDLDKLGYNVKIVAAISPQLFRMQPASYRETVIAPGDRLDAMAITNRTVKLMRDWVDGPLGAEYSMGADWDDRWRTGGSVDEVMDEAHLTVPYILEGIGRFVRERPERLARLHSLVSAAERDT